MSAVAFSNNDIAIVAWTYDKHLDGCLGFAVHQHDLTSGKEQVLPALARFASQPVDAKLTTADAPIQKFWWKDLFATRGHTYRYQIVPLSLKAGATIGDPGSLIPLAGVAALDSNEVTLTEDRAPFKAYFNRGIVATQAVIKALGGKADINVLKKHISDPNDTLRKQLMGQIYEGVTSLLDRADKDGGSVNAALYELDDPLGLEKRLQASDHGDPKSRTVILGNEVMDDGGEDADAVNRANLKKAGVPVIDRILAKGQIPHNKFMVLTEQGVPGTVLTGSTNWTSTGLCTQTNNALVIQSALVANRYLKFWQALKTDVAQSDGVKKALQGQTLRSWNHDTNQTVLDTPIRLETSGATIEVLFSPNTKALLKSPPKETPNDMKRLFDLVLGAKQAVLFLAFDPGNNSILDAAGTALAKNPNLFVRGALTSTQRAGNFAQALKRSQEAPPGEGGSDMHVAVIGENGTPKAKGKPKAKSASVAPDYRAIPAGRITKDDAFGAWEAELYKYGHAIIHNKIVVIDPFSDNCTVISGSHNLGYRASHNNDENMVIIRGHKALAQAYACHVLDIYDHYAWRYWLQQMPDKFGKPLEEDDQWQERYIVGADAKSPELRFWLSASKGGDLGTAPKGSRSSTPKGSKKKSKGGARKAGSKKGAGKGTKTRKIRSKRSGTAKPKPGKGVKPKSTKSPSKRKKGAAKKK
jgi:phosphatidylserine/phosphatidylglycerophosphate/cardiolipin synthase-like enzyme